MIGEKIKGVHAHLLVKVKNDKKFGDVRRDLKIIFRQYLDVDNKNCLDYRSCPEKWV